MFCLGLGPEAPLRRVEAKLRQHNLWKALAHFDRPDYLLAHPAVRHSEVALRNRNRTRSSLVALIIQGAIFGAQVERNVAAFRHAIPADFWAELEHDKLIRSDAPTPA